MLACTKNSDLSLKIVKALLQAGARDALVNKVAINSFFKPELFLDRKNQTMKLLCSIFYLPIYPKGSFLNIRSL